MSIKTALAGGGAILTAGAFLLGTLIGEQAQPVDNVIQPAFAPVASNCPPAFKDVSSEDEHGPTRACFLGANPQSPQPGDWIVSLKADGSFSHAIEVGRRSVDDPAEVPGWPR